jgi:hypothetical protein
LKSHFALVFLCACSAQAPHLSPDVSTRDIRIAVVLDATAAGRLTATMTGPGGDVVLLAPERLVTTQGGMEWPMVHVAKDYVTDIGNTSGPMEMRFERSGDETAIEPFVIPPPFTVKAPAIMSRAVGMMFTWDGQVSTGQTSFALNGPCIASLGRMLGTDTGNYAINPAELQSTGPFPASCDVTLTITRKVTSSGGASTLKGFSSDFTVVSTTTFTSTP